MGAYSAAWQKWERGRGTYGLLLLAPRNMTKSVLIKAWGSPKYGEKGSVWVDHRDTNLVAVNAAVADRRAKDYKLITGSDDVGLTLEDICDPKRPYMGIISKLHEFSLFEKLIKFCGQAEMALHGSDSAAHTLAVACEAVLTKKAGPPFDPDIEPIGLERVMNPAPRESVVDPTVAMPDFGVWA